MRDTDKRAGEPREHAFEIDDLKQGVLHVWHMGLDAADSLGASAFLALQPQEQAHADRLKLPAVRQRFVATRILLRSILGRYLGIAPEAVHFEQNEYGKPRLAGTEPDRGLVFNVSHTADQLAVALGFETRLGVDIEYWRTIDDCAALASRCLAPTELLHWHSLPETDRLPAFFRIWTLKEAFCKAVGRGLALGLECCVFDLSVMPPQLLTWPGDESGRAGCWRFYEMSDLSQTSGALAVDRQPIDIRRYGASTF